MSQKTITEFFETALKDVDWRTYVRETAEDIRKYGGAITLRGPKPVTAMVLYDEEFAMKQFIRQLKRRGKPTRNLNNDDYTAAKLDTLWEPSYVYAPKAHYFLKVT